MKKKTKTLSIAGFNKPSFGFIEDTTNRSIEQLKANQDKMFVKLIKKVTSITEAKEFAEAISKGLYGVEKLHIFRGIDIMLLSDSKGVYLGSIITKLYLASNTGNTIKFDQGFWEHIPNNRTLKLKDVVENPDIVLSLIDFS